VHYTYLANSHLLWKARYRDGTTHTATQDPNESFTYDDDGNLTRVCGTGVSPVNYTWDAENRLTCVQSGDPNSPANGDKKVEFVYDFLGRRVEKKVSTHNGTSWSVSDRRRFVWSDWLPVLGCPTPFRRGGRIRVPFGRHLPISPPPSERAGHPRTRARIRASAARWARDAMKPIGRVLVAGGRRCHRDSTRLRIASVNSGWWAMPTLQNCAREGR
jgi:YD repeat-containing protein